MLMLREDEGGKLMLVVRDKMCSVVLHAHQQVAIGALASPQLSNGQCKL